MYLIPGQNVSEVMEIVSHCNVCNKLYLSTLPPYVFQKQKKRKEKKI